MTWLTRIVPDLASRRARDTFANAGELHRMLIGLSARSLGEKRVESPRQQAGLLFRLEEMRSSPVLLVQSSSALDLELLGEDFGETAERDLDPFLDSLDKGQEVRYRIAAAPSKRLGKSEKNTDRLGDRARKGVKAYTRPLFGEEAADWWRSRAAGHGLELTGAAAVDGGLALDPGRSGRRGVRLHVTRFDGSAVVSDPEALRKAVREGIGRGKSFGCGMLSLAPAERRAR
ncbi:type I-E CRISPR-associated protein Cas6/Cse3/CasE [Nocardiopsis algeriensis]|uniref:type I-E CRISPR-associated protein Cas6/Cse3/CasE n=1 Tax=Nocardiopsis algeriensis TaxID=1478215 RepID=UPI003B42C969